MQIIYLNGPSSSGKTTLEKALQDFIDTPFLHVSFDKLIGLMPQKMNNWTGDPSPLGFSWKRSYDKTGTVIQTLNMGSFANKIQSSFRDITLSLAKNGHHLIIDDFVLSQDNTRAWKEILKDFSVLWVNLTAPLDVLEKREKERACRIEGSARSQYFENHTKTDYDLIFNTHMDSTDLMIQKIQRSFTLNIRHEILLTLNSIKPFDQIEINHISFIQKWIDSEAPIFRIAKPATPDIHLVSYFLLFDESMNKVLLVDHKKAGLWLPSGGHVEPDEHPKETVKRELFEELGLAAVFLLQDPLFVTVTKTVGLTECHTDVSFWYVLKGNSSIAIDYDQGEFNGIYWFDLDAIPYENTDPHMKRFIQKFEQNRILSKINA